MGTERLSSKIFKPHNLYLIITKLGIHISIVKLHIQSKYDLYESHRSGETFIQNFVSPLKGVISSC